MNLEDLILDTQISELKRLQTRCTEARGGIQKIRARVAELNANTEKAVAELRVRHAAELKNAISKLDAEAQKHREHAVASSDSLKVAARQNRERLLGELHSRLQFDIAETRRLLKAEVDSLQAGDNAQATFELADVSGTVESTSSPTSLPMRSGTFESQLATTAMARGVASPLPAVVEPEPMPSTDIERDTAGATVSGKKRRKDSKKAKKIEPAPVMATPEPGGQPVGDELPGDRVDFDEADASDNLAPVTRSGGISGGRLFVICLLIFACVTIGMILSRIDFGTLMTFALSEADLTWAAISAGIGVVGAVVVGLLLRLFGSRKQRNVRSTASSEVQEKVKAVPSSQITNAPVANVDEEAVADEAATDIVGEVSGDVNAEFAEDGAFAAQMSPEQVSSSGAQGLVSMSPVGGRVVGTVASSESLTLERLNAVNAIQAKYDAMVGDLIHRYTQHIALHVDKIEDQVINGSNATAEALQSIDAWRLQELGRIEQHYKLELERAEAAFLENSRIEPKRLADEAKTIHARWKGNFTIACELARIIRDRASVYPSWSEMASRPWSAPKESLVTLTVGDIRATFPAVPDYPEGDIDSELIMDLPGVVNFPQNCSISVQHDSAGRDASTNFVNGLLLRLLTSLPPNGAKFSLIDPMNHGECFAGLTRLAKFNDQLVDVCSSTNSVEIDDRLLSICDRIESVQLACLQSSSKSIQENNRKEGATLIPYHYVVLTGFAKCLTETSARHLTTILNEGPRCGIHAIIVWSADQVVPRSFDMGEIRSCCVLFNAINGSVQPSASPSQRPVEVANQFVEFTPLAPPDAEVYSKLVSAVGQHCQSDGSAAAFECDLQPVMAAVDSSPSEETAVTSQVVPVDESESKAETHESSVPLLSSTMSTPDDSVTAVDFVNAAVAVEPKTSVAELKVTDDAGDSGAAIPSSAPDDVTVSTSSANVAVSARMEDCGPLQELRSSTTADLRSPDGSVPVWLGEAGGSNAAFGIRLVRSRGQNLLMVGSDSGVADSLLAGAALSLCSGSTTAGKPRSACMILLHDQQDGGSFDRFSSSFHKDVVPGLTIRGMSDTETLIAVLSKEVSSREAARGSGDFPNIVFAVRNVGQYPSLHRDSDNSAEGGSSKASKSKVSAAKSKFGDLIRKGPQLGIHVVLWADTLAAAMQMLSHSLLREFDLRIALPMSESDSIGLIGVPDAASLSPGMAVLRNEGTGTRAEFRPFSWSSVEWTAHGEDGSTEQPTGSASTEVIIGADTTGDSSNLPVESVPVEVAISGTAVSEAQSITDDIGSTLLTSPEMAADIEPFAEQLAQPVVVDLPIVDPPVASEVLPDFGVADEVSGFETQAVELASVETPSNDPSQGETPQVDFLDAKAEVVGEITEADRDDVPELSVSSSQMSVVPTEFPSVSVDVPVVSEPSIPSPLISAKIVDSVPEAVVESPASASRKASGVTPPAPVVATTPTPASQSQPRGKKPSAMAARLAARNSDPGRPLDAPPDRRASQAVSGPPSGPSPDADFDEMDFNSIMIE